MTRQPEGPAFEPTPEEPGGRMPQLLQVIWQRKPLVLLGLFVGLAVGAVVYLYRSPVYQSSAAVLVIKKRPDVPLTGTDTRYAYYEDYISTQLTLLKSEDRWRLGPFATEAETDAVAEQLRSAGLTVEKRWE